MSKRFQRVNTNYNNPNNNNANNNKYNSIKKYYKIFILTKDDYYLIIEKRKLYKSFFFKNIFDMDKTSGNINNPMFLKEKHSLHLKCVIEYLNYYYNKIDYFENHTNITFNDVNVYYNKFDQRFFSRFENYSIKDLEVFKTMISYYLLPSLNQKLNLYLFFLKNKHVNK
tara:strand:- start:1150 stop:1656 length:507 start_codon:yes stop_codon:yes gene_type:complete